MQPPDEVALPLLRSLAVMLFLVCTLACSDQAHTSPLSALFTVPSSELAQPATEKTKEYQRGGVTPELPRVLLDYTMPVVTGRSIKVRARGDLQDALNDARRGDEIVLAAGATYVGNFVLPAKSGTSDDGWIVIRSDGQLPPMGTRVSPEHADQMAQIVTPNVSPAIATAGPSSGWWLSGIEVTVSPAVTAQQYGIITQGGNQTTLSAAPQDLVLDRMYIHGQTTSNVSRCVALNSGRTQISDSYITECHGKDFQAQAVAGWNGSGPFKIVNNMLMGSGESLMFGGADPATPNLVPSDIEIRRNYLYTPVAWKGVWYKANLLETKNAVRVLIEGNVFDGSWTDAQTGWAIILKSENQSGACAWCRTTDVTLRRNLIRNAGGGINFAPATNGADSTTSRILVYENVLENIGVGAFTGDQRGFQFLTTTKNLTIERSVLSGSLASALVTEGGAPCVLKDNVWGRGAYGVVASGHGPGTTSLKVGCGTYVWSGMTLLGSSSGNAYPTGTTWASSESQAPLAAQIRSIVQQAVSGVALSYRTN